MTKKRIGIYSVLCTGHLNVCASIATALLNNHSDKVEIYFIVNETWANKLRKIDGRFKYALIEVEEENDRIGELIEKIEPFLKSTLVDRLINSWINFLKWETLFDIDVKTEAKIKDLNIDLIISDQVCHLPAMQAAPQVFITSCNPLLHGLEGFPLMGSGLKINDLEGINQFKKDFSQYRTKMNQELMDFFAKRGKTFKSKYAIDQPLSEIMTIYAYPRELDYYNDEIRRKHNLVQIDSPLFATKIPKKFDLPEHFKGHKIIYVSLGSLLSVYLEKLQRLVNILDKLPYRYIFSKGARGDELVFPSNKFIGDIWIDQLAVLQVADAMIAHGGNNTFCECIYFGVPQLILPGIVDQLDNAVHVEETGYGYSLNLLNYTDEQLADRLNRLLNDEDLKLRLKKTSDRIRSGNKVEEAAEKLVNFLTK